MNKYWVDWICVIAMLFMAWYLTILPNPDGLAGYMDHYIQSTDLLVVGGIVNGVIFSVLLLSRKSVPNTTRMLLLAPMIIYMACGVVWGLLFGYYGLASIYVLALFGLAIYWRKYQWM